ncbi:MAG: cytochrome c oxidase accessory protein CcoG [Pseudomonadota bacterium]
MNGFNERELGISRVGSVTEIYQELEPYPVNIGEKTIHAKRMPGFFRSFKTWMQTGLWLSLCLLPYLRWNGKQAIMFDIDHSQFHCFNLTVRPDEMWMLMLVFIAASMLMFFVTNVVSRAWCGYMCFQTAWTDLFTWIEDKVEGNPAARRKLDAAPWSADKIIKKVAKHLIWLGVGFVTAISFTIWFVDAFEFWDKLIHLQLPKVAWVTLVLIITGTYLYAGLMREQLCSWICPYARFQSVMADTQTILPSYDFKRGEPRGKVRKGSEVVKQQGDCIDCYQCVQVCPTGVDIRKGHQLSCITCGLCIDACNSVMDKFGKPHGLIRYASTDEIHGKPHKKRYQNPWLWVYTGIFTASVIGILYGLTHMTSVNLSVRPERQPLFVRMSDGSIQNKYVLKILNKTDKDMHFAVSTEGNITGRTVIGAEKLIPVKPQRGAALTIFVKAPAGNISKEVTPLRFRVQSIEDSTIAAAYDTKFYAP